MKKYTLVHSGNRDYYKIAEALAASDRLNKLVTDDYILRKNSPECIKHYVKTSYLALFFNLLARIIKYGWVYSIKDKVLSLAALKEAKASGSNLLCYSYYAGNAFSRKFNGDKILFQLHPHPKSVRDIFLNEIVHNPLAKKSLAKEHELNLSAAAFNKMVLEPKLADYIITTSGFTRQTLIENNVPANKIKVVPYGVELIDFNERKEYKRALSCLEVIFVGSINQRKGLSYLCEACKLMQDKDFNIHLRIIGRGIKDDSLIRHYNLKNVIIEHNLPKYKLIEAYKSADVFVLPSLCEGFGHVILEAMATGLPVITTANTAGRDIITNGIEGFIVPVANSISIEEKLTFLYNNPVENVKMGKQAAEKASQFNWDRFKHLLIKELEQIEND